MMQFLPLGTRVSVRFLFGLFEHVGLVSGYYANGEPAIVSISAAKGFVQEPLSAFAAGQQWFYKEAPRGLAPEWVVMRALSMAGRPYDLFSWNCEHLVSYAYGQKAHSPQLAAIVATAIGAVAVTSLLKS